MTPQLRVARTMWATMLLSTFVYLLVPTQVPRPPAPTQPILLPVLAVIGLFETVLSVVFPAMQLQRGLKRLNLPVEERQDMNTERLFRDLPTTTRGLKDPQAAIREAWPLYNKTFIVGMALSEANALFGLVLLILGFPWFPTILFFAVSWVLIFYHFPTERRLLKAIERTSGILQA